LREIWIVVAGIVCTAFVVMAITDSTQPFETRAAARRAQLRFAAAGVDSYEVDVERFCCFDSGAFHIVVRNGAITEVSELRSVGNALIGGPYFQVRTWDHVPRRASWVKSWGRIDRAFVSIGSEAGADVVEVSFDHMTGVPHRYYRDWDTNSTDDYLTVLWSKFRPLD
jgi:hypothetical protein